MGSLTREQRENIFNLIKDMATDAHANKRITDVEYDAVRQFVIETISATNVLEKLKEEIWKLEGTVFK